MFNRHKTKNTNAFTLVELMIVVAVIALLILVLLPRIGVIKNKAREAGLRSNMVMMEGIIHSIIDDYDGAAASTDTPANVEARIKADIDAATTINQNLKNPFTGGKDVTVDDYGSITAANVAAASDDDDAIDGGGIAAEWTNVNTNAAGVIGYAAYKTTAGKFEVVLMPYGADSKMITKLKKTISQ